MRFYNQNLVVGQGSLCVPNFNMEGVPYHDLLILDNSLSFQLGQFIFLFWTAM